MEAPPCPPAPADDDHMCLAADLEAGESGENVLKSPAQRQL